MVTAGLLPMDGTHGCKRAIDILRQADQIVIGGLDTLEIPQSILLVLSTTFHIICL